MHKYSRRSHLIGKHFHGQEEVFANWFDLRGGQDETAATGIGQLNCIAVFDTDRFRPIVRST